MTKRMAPDADIRDELDEWAAQVEARHNFPDSGDDLNAGGFPW